MKRPHFAVGTWLLFCILNRFFNETQVVSALIVMQCADSIEKGQEKIRLYRPRSYTIDAMARVKTLAYKSSCITAWIHSWMMGSLVIFRPQFDPLWYSLCSAVSRTTLWWWHILFFFFFLHLFVALLHVLSHVFLLSWVISFQALLCVWRSSSAFRSAFAFEAWASEGCFPSGFTTVDSFSLLSQRLDCDKL